MNIKKAFTYMFLDKELPKNFVIFILLSIVFIAGGIAPKIANIIVNRLPQDTVLVIMPFIAILVTILVFLSILTYILMSGYWIQIISNCNSCVDKVMPDWLRNTGTLFLKGLKFRLAVLAQYGFIIIVYVCLFYFIPSLIKLLPISPIFSDIILIILFILYSIACVLLIAAGEINFVHKNSLSAFLQLTNLFRIISFNFKEFILICFIPPTLFLILCLILILLEKIFYMHWYYNIIYLITLTIIFFYCYLVNANLLGQYYKQYFEAQQN